MVVGGVLFAEVDVVGCVGLHLVASTFDNLVFLVAAFRNDALRACCFRFFVVTEIVYVDWFALPRMTKKEV